MTPFAAALLSFLFPGLGQASVGSRGRAAIVALPMLAVLGVLALILIFDRSSQLGLTPDQGLLTSLLILDLMLFVYHLWAVLDAYVLARNARPDWLPRGASQKWATVLSVGVLVSGTVGVHAAVAEVSISWQRSLSCNTGATPCWFDISYPQCGSPFPDNAEFGIVGVNHGKVFSANPCLSTGDGPPELTWAGGVRAQLYANTGNPGPDLSTRWPSNQTSPRQCNTSAVPGSDTADCAYDYGWNAAADSYRTAVSAYVSLGLASAGATSTPSPNAWWLDVEIINSWRPDVTFNVAALKGAVAYLQSVGNAGIGFYSTQYQWNQITGGTSDFSAYPSWVAGANSAGQAVGICSAKGFTGGRVALVQYHAGGFDADFLCQGNSG
ncbi:MAG TPA: hypothetical protein VF344_00530 [Candidatus Limnocylindrales bacterium]